MEPKPWLATLPVRRLAALLLSLRTEPVLANLCDWQKPIPHSVSQHQFPIPTTSIPSTTPRSTTTESNRAIWGRGRALQVSRLFVMTVLRWAVA